MNFLPRLITIFLVLLITAAIFRVLDRTRASTSFSGQQQQQQEPQQDQEDKSGRNTDGETTRKLAVLEPSHEQERQQKSTTPLSFFDDDYRHRNMWLFSSSSSSNNGDKAAKRRRERCKIIRGEKTIKGGGGGGSSTRRSAPSAFSQVIGTGGSLGPSRFWVLTFNANKQPQCREEGAAADTLEISMESANAKVAVDRVIDRGDGIHEVQVFVRKPGRYVVCVDIVLSFDDASEKNIPLMSESTIGKTWTTSDKRRDAAAPGKTSYCVGGGGQSQALTEIAQQESDDLKRGKNTTGRTTADTTIPVSAEIVMASIPSAACSVSQQYLGDPVVPASKRRCGTHRDDFRFGAWYKLPPSQIENKIEGGGGGVGKEEKKVWKCDGVHCTGTTALLQKSEGWVWVSDRCRMQYYGSAAEIWDSSSSNNSKSSSAGSVVAGKWIIGWGGSTMKQPLSNFVEYMLQVQVFKTFMENLDRYPGPKKKVPGFFSYRAWDINRTRSAADTKTTAAAAAAAAVRVTMVWGGCRGIAAPPSQCPTEVGMTNRAPLERYITEAHAAGTVTTPVILLNHFIWRSPMFDEVQFLEQITSTIRWLQDKFKPLKPKLLWHTGPHTIHSNISRQCSAPPFLPIQRHFAMSIEDHLIEKHSSDVTIISRFHLTAPFHLGDRFVHFGVHYGATKGMCRTGVSYKNKYEFSQCVRRTFVDDVLIMMWLNALSHF